MPNKQDAKQKLNAAEKASTKACQARYAAYCTLKTGVTVNGYGIVRDPSSLHGNLLEAQEQIKIAIAALAEVDWPTDADYNVF